MDPLQIVLVVVGIAAVWALVEIALLARRGRSSVQNLDSAVGEINETLAEAKPIIAKLDDTLEDLQPAVQRVEPLLASANIAVDALSANLVEVEAVVRDVSSFTGSAVSAKHAVRDAADTATDAVQRLFGKRRPAPADPERTLEEAPEPAGDVAGSEAPADAEGADVSVSESARGYYTYGDDASVSPATDSEESHE